MPRALMLVASNATDEARIDGGPGLCSWSRGFAYPLLPSPIRAARNRDLEIAGVVLNQPDPLDPLDRSLETNARAIEHYGNVNVLGHVVHGERDLRPSDGTATIDWSELAGCRT